jgi:hypothetical protein
MIHELMIHMLFLIKPRPSWSNMILGWIEIQGWLNILLLGLVAWIC